MKGAAISVLIFMELVFGANAWSAPKDCNGILSWPSRIKTYWRDRNAYYEQVRELFPRIQAAQAAQQQSASIFQSNFAGATRELGFASSEQSQLKREIEQRFGASPDELMAHFQTVRSANGEGSLGALSSEDEQRLELLILYSQSGVRVKHWLLELESMILREVESRRQLVQDQIAYFKLVQDAKVSAAYEKMKPGEKLPIFERDLPNFEATEASQTAKVNFAEVEKSEALARLRLLSGFSPGGDELHRRDILQPIYKGRNQRIPTIELVQPPPPAPQAAVQNLKPAANIAQLETAVFAAQRVYEALRPTAASKLLPKLQEAIVQRNFALRYFLPFEDTFQAVRSKNLSAPEIQRLTITEKASVEAWLMFQVLEQRRARIELEFDRQGSWARAEAQVNLLEARLNFAQALGESRAKTESLRNSLELERRDLETMRASMRDIESALANLRAELAAWQGHWPPWDQILRTPDRQMLFANDGHKI